MDIFWNCRIEIFTPGSFTSMKSEHNGGWRSCLTTTCTLLVIAIREIKIKMFNNNSPKWR